MSIDQRSALNGHAPTAPARDCAEAAVQITDVTKAFGQGSNEVVALGGVALSVGPGEFVCLIGASGCGKSTLLSLVAGLEEPTAGQVSVYGRVALMFQEPALFPWLTAAGRALVRRAVTLSVCLRGRGRVPPAGGPGGPPRAERRARAAELLEAVHL